jgi:hypothetical protein
MSASAHEVLAEHVHAGPVVFEVLPLPLIVLGIVGVGVISIAVLLQRSRTGNSNRDER